MITLPNLIICMLLIHYMALCYIYEKKALPLKYIILIGSLFTSIAKVTFRNYAFLDFFLATSMLFWFACLLIIWTRDRNK